ncbi:MAG: hypothetical protein JXQ79_04505 [Rhodobacteraceae bacterium]|nr:hypothetical protein [Paracoccaceae bacterium]
MTEAMSRHEIEDVLSSIRRLVSHEDRAAQEHVKSVPEASGKLVLTSALRVDEADTPEMLPEQTTQAASAELVNTAPAPSATPAFAEAPARPPLLKRIAQAGQTASTPERPLAEEAKAATDNAVTESVSDTVLEATLARLEEALAITPAEPERSTDTVIDEDVLTQIVAKIVRQELQGELGERITRNIRKLVRAEVARELQMRNL